MPETETLEQNIELAETFPEAVAELQSELEDKINDAIILGVFTDAEAEAWRDGFEACQKLEHMDNLVEMIGRFIASGESVLAELQTTLETKLSAGDKEIELFSDKEKRDAEWQAEMLSYPDKWQLIGDLKKIIAEVKRYHKQLVKILHTAKLSEAEAEVCLQKFAEADADKKEGVITRVAATVVELNVNYPIVQSRIMELLQNGQFGEARVFLHGSQMKPDEYERLTSKIDLAESNHFRTLALSA